VQRSAEDLETAEPEADLKRVKGADGEAKPAAAAAASPELLKKVQTLINFYFSDANFTKDKFLKAEAAKHPDGLVAVSVLLTFNKLKQLTTDPNVVVQAAQNSPKLAVSTARS
jgi:La domain